MRSHSRWLGCVVCIPLGVFTIACGDDASTSAPSSAAGAAGKGSQGGAAGASGGLGGSGGRAGNAGFGAGSAGGPGGAAGASPGGSGGAAAGAAGIAGGGAAGATGGGAAATDGGAAGATNGGAAGATNGGAAGATNGGAAGASNGGAAGAGGSPSPTTGPCRATGGPDVLLDVVKTYLGQETLSDGTRVVFGDGGLCAVPVDGKPNVLVWPGAATFRAVGGLVLLRTEEGGAASLRLWKRGMAEPVLVAALGAATGEDTAPPEALALPGDERLVWLKSQSLKTSVRSFAFGGTDVELVAATEGTSVRIERTQNKVVFAVSSLTFGAGTRVGTVSADGAVTELCQACAYAGVISAQSPWIPLATNPLEATGLLLGKESTLVLHHDTTSEKRDLSKSFQLGRGIRGGAQGQAFFASNLDGLVAWHDPSTGSTQTSASSADGLQGASDDGRFAVVAADGVGFFGVDGDGKPHTWPITLGANEGLSVGDAFSADGAYATYLTGPGSPNPKLHRMSLKTGEAKVVAGLGKPGSLSISTARRHSLFAGDGALLRELDLATGLQVQLAPGSWPKTLPDDAGYTYVDPQGALRRAAFSNEAGNEGTPICGRTGPADVLLDRARVTDFAGVPHLLDDTLLVDDGGALCAVFPDGTTSQKLRDEGAASVVVEGGGRIAAFAEDQKLSVWKRGLSLPREISAKFRRALGSGSDIAVSADGSRLLFLEAAGPPGALDNVRSYSFATDASVTVATGFVDSSEGDALQTAQGALVYRVLSAFLQPTMTGAVLADGSKKELCLGCTSFLAAAESPWMFTSIPSKELGVPPAATLIHVSTGERRDLSTKVLFSRSARFSSDGSKLFTPSKDGRLARYDVATGAVDLIGPALGSADTVGSFAPKRDGSAFMYAVHTGGVGQKLFLARESAFALPTLLGSTPDGGTVEPRPTYPFTWDEGFAFFGGALDPNDQSATYSAVSVATGAVTKFPQALFGRGLVGSRVVLGSGVPGEMGAILLGDLASGASTNVAFGELPTPVKKGNALVYIAADRRLRLLAAP